MTTTRLLSTVAALGSARTHISGGWPIPRNALPLMDPDKPSRKYSD